MALRKAASRRASWERATVFSRLRARLGADANGGACGSNRSRFRIAKMGTIVPRKRPKLLKQANGLRLWKIDPFQPSCRTGVPRAGPGMPSPAVSV